MNLLLSDVVIDEDGEEFFGVKNSKKLDDKSDLANNSEAEFHCKIYSIAGPYCPLKRIKFYLSKISQNAYLNPQSKFLQKVV